MSENVVFLRDRMSLIKAEAAKILASDDTIAKLLIYPDPNALQFDVDSSQKRRLILQDEKNEHRRIYLSPFTTFKEDTELSEIRIHFNRINIKNVDYLYNPILTVDVYCHSKLSALSDGINQRYDLLMQRTHDILVDQHIETTGTFDCQSIMEWCLKDSSFIGYTLAFQCGEIRP